MNELDTKSKEERRFDGNLVLIFGRLWSLDTFEEDFAKVLGEDIQRGLQKAIKKRARQKSINNKNNS